MRYRGKVYKDGQGTAVAARAGQPRAVARRSGATAPAYPAPCVAACWSSAWSGTKPRRLREPATAGYRITNGFAIGSLDRFIQIVFGRV